MKRQKVVMSLGLIILGVCAALVLSASMARAAGSGGQTDLSVEIEGPSGPIHPNEVATYTITGRNNGPVTAQEVEILLTWREATLVAITDGMFDCSEALPGRGRRCTLSELAVNAEGEVTLQLRADGGAQTIIVQANIGAQNGDDFYTGDNAASAITRVLQLLYLPFLSK